MKKNVPEKIYRLRQAMSLHNIQAFIIPSSDPHMSEYPPERWKIRQWISGFTGSAGTLVVTTDKAGLWTDSRYFLQAEEELRGSGIQLYKMMQPGTPTIPQFLVNELSPGEEAGIDGETWSIAETRRLREELKKEGITLNTSCHLIHEIYADQPAIPENPIFEVPISVAGKETREKILEIKDTIRQYGCNAILLTALDEIAWTFNLRGNDADYNPVFVSYAFISDKESILFINPRKVSFPIKEELFSQNVKIKDYTEIHNFLRHLSSHYRILIDPGKVNRSLYDILPGDVSVKEAPSPVTLLKSIKNPTEVNGFRKAVINDGIALVRFYIWLEENRQKQPLTELDCIYKLKAYRQLQTDYVSDSFNTICGAGAHGAIVHYSATPESNAPLAENTLLLIDSGAQYRTGTTDITRTTVMGTPTPEMKKDFTLVLKGNIALSRARFPAGTRGSQLDILARQYLWENGLNYLHGTGHGIGHFLNVHEGPQSIRMDENPVSLKPGMVISNEPALYRTGQYGIRTENMILVQEEEKSDYGTFYSFKTLTLCPIDLTLIEKKMLSSEEKEWLNNYHRKVYRKLSPYLTTREQEWLKEKTNPL